MTIRWRPISLLLLLALIAAACDGDGETATTAAEPSTSTTTTAAETTTTTTTTDPGPVGLTAPVVRLPPTGEFIYFVMTDRFDNGDPTNDTGGLGSGTEDADVLRHGFLPTNTGYYHGGDITGLERRLGYLADLGVSSIWITPPFGNRTVQGNGSIAGSSAGYHGYWQTDFTRIDPHLGTNDEMRALGQRLFEV